MTREHRTSRGCDRDPARGGSSKTKHGYNLENDGEDGAGSDMSHCYTKRPKTINCNARKNIIQKVLIKCVIERYIARFTRFVSRWRCSLK